MQPTYQENVYVSSSPAFFSKVIFFFALAILVSLLGFSFATNYLLPYFLSQPALIWIAFIGELGLIFTSGIWSTKRPLNYFLFSLFAFLTGITVVPVILSVAAEFGGYAIISKALLTTILVFSAAALFGRTTNYNLSGLRGFLLFSLIGMIVIGLIGIFIPWGNSFEMLFSGFGVIIFSAFTMYDVQKLKAYPEDRYIDAALNLYLDIFNLFIFLLRLMSAIRRD